MSGSPLKFHGVLPLPCGCKADFTDRVDDDGKGVIEFDLCREHMQECVERVRKEVFPKFLYGEGEPTVPWRRP